MVIVSSRFGSYLDEAVSGRISADVLFSIIFLRIPSIMELVVPLSFFVALLFALGRLYIDSEITALNACGFSRRRLLANTLGSAGLIALLVGLLSLWLSPLSLDSSNAILEKEKARSEFETLGAGQFQPLGNAGSVIYAGAISSDRKLLKDVFASVAHESDIEDGITTAESTKPPVLIKAESAEQIYDEKYQRKYLRINNGQRVDGAAGQADYRVVDFENYAQLLEGTEIKVKAEHDRLGTLDLWQKRDSAAVAALHWRFGLPVLVLILAVLGVPLAATDPRRGRYTKMIPAIVLYMMYLVALNATRGAIEDGKLAGVALWIVHFLALLVGLFLFNSDWLGRHLGARRQRKAQHA